MRLYTLSGTSLLLAGLPPPIVKHAAVPAALPGRLAVATAFQNRHFGASLLADAALRASRANLAVFAVVTDPNDDRTRQFYLKHGFIKLPGTPLRLFAPTLL